MFKKALRSPIVTAVLVACAVALIGFGGVGAATAAPRIESRQFGAQVELSSIKTALVENEEIVDDGALLGGLVPDGQKFQVGKAYDEVLKVENTGTIDEYVRVSVYRYWVDKDGNQIKDTKLRPEFIELNFVEGDGWTIDDEASTEERTVLYYSKPIAPGERTSEFLDKLSVSLQTTAAITNIDGKSISKYEGVTFRLEAVADAVQTHNGTQAMTGAWGRTN